MRKKLISQLNSRLKELAELLTAIDSDLDGMPEGSVNISRSHNTIQYYFKKPGSGNKRKYIDTHNEDLVRQLVQKEYLLDLKRIAGIEHKAIKRMLSSLPDCPAEQVIENFSELRKTMIVPLIESDEMYVRNWLGEPYPVDESLTAGSHYITENGEKVRSKSEYMIANMLLKNRIPYKYEKPLRLIDRTVRPDFTILDAGRRREIYLEHLGMMDDPDYASKAVAKIETYGRTGIYQGDRLLLTMETADSPLNIQLIEDTVLKAIA